MCGISGGIFLNRYSKNKKLINKICNFQEPRGPDFSQVISQNTFFGEVITSHNRLAIIDLEKHSNQPFFSNDERFVISFNGEIYNYLEIKKELECLGHQFKTSSDTEVLLTSFIQWGYKCTEFLNGFFAFSIFDFQENKLFLFRDRFGVKPLFYHKNDGSFVYASSSNIIASNFSLHPNLNYLARGDILGIFEDGSSETAYEGLKSLKAGHFIEVKIKNKAICFHEEKYYDLENRVNKKYYNPNNIYEETLNLLQDSIELRLRADVKIGVSLSGGVDSTSIAALAKDANGNIEAFSYGAKDNPLSEGSNVSGIADFLNIRTTYIQEKNQKIFDILEDTLTYQDAPFTSLSILMQNFVFRTARSHNFKVLLGGQGGDEIFMGYRKYLLSNLINQLHQKKISIFDILYFIQSTIVDRAQIGLYAKKFKSYFFSKASQPSIFLENFTVNKDYYDFSNLRKRQILDIKKYSLPTLLRYEDRSSSFNSVESRLPFLDYRLVEHALSIPDNLKLKKGYGKWILRSILKDKIPEIIRINRAKRGFDDYQYVQFIKSHRRSLTEKLKINMCEDFLSARIDKTIFSEKSLLKEKKNFYRLIALIWMQKKI